MRALPAPRKKRPGLCERWGLNLKQKTMFRIFKALACLFVLLYFYPFFYFFNAIFTPAGQTRAALAQTGLLLMPGAMGYLLGFGLGRTNLSAVKKNLIKIAVAPFAMGLFFAVVFPLWGLWNAVAAAVLAGVLYFVAYALFYLPYGQVINNLRYLVMTGIYAGALFILWAVRLPMDAPSFVLVFLAATAIYLLVSNQSNIDYMMQRRRHALSHLPEKIRRYNILLVGGIFVLLLALFLLKDWIILGIAGLGELLRRALVYLLNMSFSDGEAPLPDDPGANGGEDFPLEPGEPNPVVQAVLTLAVAAVLIFLVVYYRRSILEAFQNLYRWVRDAVYRLFHKDRAAVRVDDSSEYYLDLEETLLPAEYTARRRVVSGMRQWRRAVKEYSRMADGPEKFRRGYALIVEGLTLRQIPIRQSDTTLEIMDKSAEALPPSSLAIPTAGYNALRYGERTIPLEQIGQIDALLAQMKKKNGAAAR